MSADTDDFTLTRTLPTHGWCFVCGDDNPHGIGLRWLASFQQSTPDADGHFPPRSVVVFAAFQFTLAQQGPPGHAHGGASAAVIDEAMGASVWVSGYQALLAHYELDYILPVPLHTPLRAEAWVENVDGRKIFARGRLLLDDGRTAVTGTGLYLHIPGFFEKNAYRHE